MQDLGRDNSKVYDTRGTSDPFLSLASVVFRWNITIPFANKNLVTHSCV